MQVRQILRHQIHAFASSWHVGQPRAAKLPHPFPELPTHLHDAGMMAAPIDVRLQRLPLLAGRQDSTSMQVC